ncbi:MAG: methyltransferase family protein [Herbinix sp.]|jgi:predicted TPR repeat methyltransferase|nr:methyltransferase family protein [Herbinix sp.]
MKTMADYFNEEAVKHDDFFVGKLGMTEFYDELEHQIDTCNNKNNILVLGCGTGLEIERIKCSTYVTAIDIAEKMLVELKKKALYKGLFLTTICGSLLDLNFGHHTYDLVLSCYVMHHFNEEQKITIYEKIFNCLTDNGVFIHGDSMEKNYEDEQLRYKEAENIYIENNLPFASLHIDIPFCIEHEISVLNKVGFNDIVIEKEWSRTKLYRATKRME